jgi:myo-inositol-1(or 4)-monophosphatase
MAVDLPFARLIMGDVAKHAGRVLLNMQPTAIRLESRKDFLVNADLESDRLIKQGLAIHFPDITYTSEELENQSKEGLHWVVDPVDGTVNYVLRDDNWAVSIALVDGEETVAAAIYIPARDELYSAAKDDGALLIKSTTQQILWVNEEQTLKNSQFWTEWVKDDPVGEATERVLKNLEKLRRHSIYPQMRNSASADPMAVARGQVSGFIMSKPDPFDVAAAGLIIREAGGMVTDLEGKRWNTSSKSIVATNGRVHDELLSLLNS